MATQTTVTVTTTPTLLATGVGTVYLQADGGGTIVIGDSSVTTTTGLKVELEGTALVQRPPHGFRISSTDELYGVVATGSLAVRVLHTR